MARIYFKLYLVVWGVHIRDVSRTKFLRYVMVQSLIESELIKNDAIAMKYSTYFLEFQKTSVVTIGIYV